MFIVSSLLSSVVLGSSLGLLSGVVPMLSYAFLAKVYIVKEVALKKTMFACCTYAGVYSIGFFAACCAEPLDNLLGGHSFSNLGSLFACAVGFFAIVSAPLLSTSLSCGFNIGVLESTFYVISGWSIALSVHKISTPNNNQDTANRGHPARVLNNL